MDEKQRKRYQRNPIQFWKDITAYGFWKNRPDKLEPEEKEFFKDFKAQGFKGEYLWSGGRGAGKTSNLAIIVLHQALVLGKNPVCISGSVRQARKIMYYAKQLLLNNQFLKDELRKNYPIAKYRISLKSGNQILVIPAETLRSERTDCLILDEANDMTDSDYQRSLGMLEGSWSLILSGTPSEMKGEFFADLLDTRPKDWKIYEFNLEKRKHWEGVPEKLELMKKTMNPEQYKAEARGQLSKWQEKALFDWDLIKACDVSRRKDIRQIRFQGGQLVLAVDPSMFGESEKASFTCVSVFEIGKEFISRHLVKEVKGSDMGSIIEYIADLVENPFLTTGSYISRVVCDSNPVPFWKALRKRLGLPIRKRNDPFQTALMRDERRMLEGKLMMALRDKKLLMWNRNKEEWKVFKQLKNYRSDFKYLHTHKHDHVDSLLLLFKTVKGKTELKPSHPIGKAREKEMLDVLKAVGEAMHKGVPKILPEPEKEIDQSEYPPQLQGNPNDQIWYPAPYPPFNGELKIMTKREAREIWKSQRKWGVVRRRKLSTKRGAY